MCDATRVLADGVATVAGQDRRGWTGVARSELLIELGAIRERLDAVMLEVTAEWDVDRSWELDGARSPAAWLSHRMPVTRQEASVLVRTADHVRAHEPTAKALAAGDIIAAHATIAAQAAKHRAELYREHEDVILDAARSLTPPAFRVAMQHWANCVDDVAGHEKARDQVAANYLDANATFEGCGHLAGRLDPVSFKAFVDRLDTLEPPDPADGPRPPRTLAQRRAAALMRLVHGEQRGTVNIDVVVDVDTLAGRPSPDLTTGCCEITGLGPVPPGLVRTLACDGAIGRVLMRGTSEVLDLGRRVRLVTPALRRTLEIRDRTCTEPGCDVPAAWCDAHHIVPWWAHGPTDLDNLALRCRVHHVAEHLRMARAQAPRRE